MKNLKKLTVTVGLVIGSLLSVNANTTKTISLPEAEKEIKECVKLNNTVLKHDERVEVLFTVTKTGEVNFVFVKSNNEEVKTELTKQFSKLHFASLKGEVVHSVVLNLKLI